jgi:putative aldouronate transport system substrate-binding protein
MHHITSDGWSMNVFVQEFLTNYESDNAASPALPPLRIQYKDYAAWQAANVKTLAKPVFWNMNISMPQWVATADAAQAVEDTIKDCYHGKKKVSDVQAAIAGWKSGGGDRLKQWMTDNVLQKYGTGQ